MAHPPGKQVVKANQVVFSNIQERVKALQGLDDLLMRDVARFRMVRSVKSGRIAPPGEECVEEGGYDNEQNRIKQHRGPKKGPAEGVNSRATHDGGESSRASRRMDAFQLMHQTNGQPDRTGSSQRGIGDTFCAQNAHGGRKSMPAEHGPGLGQLAMGNAKEKDSAGTHGGDKHGGARKIEKSSADEDEQEYPDKTTHGGDGLLLKAHGIEFDAKQPFKRQILIHVRNRIWRKD